MNPRNRRHLPIIGLVLLAIIVLLYSCATLNGVHAADVATVTAQPAFGQLNIGNEAYVCHISGPTSYLCIRQDLSGTITPTRLPTVTPLTEGTNTPTPRPTPTQTATRAATGTAVLLCRDYTVLATVLNVRAKPSLSGTILKTFKKGDTISLSTKSNDTVLAEGVTWRLGCGSGDPQAWVSQNWVQVKP